MLGKTTSENPKGCYVSSRRFTKVAAGRLSEEHYTGRVWCPMTKNGTWVMRQHGHIVTTGNTFARKNIPLQLESLFTKPGKVALLDKFQRVIQNRDTGDEGVDTTILPEWLRKTVFGAERLDDGSMRIISGLGVGFEELSIFDRPFEEFASMMNPIIKGPLQQAMNKDFFRGVPLDKSDIAPNLSWFKHIPGGQSFLDAIDFRPAADGRFYRANPSFLNAVFGTLAPGTSRAAFQLTSLMNESAENTGRPEAGLRAVTGFRRSTMSATRQMQENQRRMLERYIERLEELQREGVTFEIEDRFAIRRDIARDDPRRKEARKVNRDLARAKRALSRLSRTERAAMGRVTLGSLGK